MLAVSGVAVKRIAREIKIGFYVAFDESVEVLFLLIADGGWGRNRAVHALFSGLKIQNFANKCKRFCTTLSLPGRTITDPLTEGFTETFTEGESNSLPSLLVQ